MSLTLKKTMLDQTDSSPTKPIVSECAINEIKKTESKKEPLFTDLTLPAILQTALQVMEYTSMTPIQAQVIPQAIEGRDILGSSHTGSGKTAAFLIPLITKLLATPQGSALVLAPTRELAMQVMDVAQKLCGRSSGLKTALLIGGQPMFPQLNQLRSGRVRLIVGTPGRINDHLERRSLKLNDTQFLVLDEADRMLDMGFDVQLEAIASYLPPTRQTLMFSATFHESIIKLSNKYLNNPVRVTIGTTSAPAVNIKQEVVRTTEANKYDDLLKELANREGSIIVFVKTKMGAEKLMKKLMKDDHSADTIHGDLRQRERSKVIKAFREKEHRIMVATDVAARGLDIPHIEHVINYDMPQCPEDYVHRIGRTARAGAEGAAVSLVTSEDHRKWIAIEDLINPEAAKARRASRSGGAPGAGGRRRPSNAANRPRVFSKKPFGNGGSTRSGSRTDSGAGFGSRSGARTDSGSASGFGARSGSGQRPGARIDSGSRSGSRRGSGAGFGARSGAGADANGNSRFKPR
jgi:ATP-dependent RNA helicase DeaD